MLRTLNVRQAVDLFFELEEQEGEICVSPSELESDCDDEVEDPSFVTDDKRDDEQPGTSTAPARGSGRGRQRGREKRCRSRSPCDRSSQPHHSPEAWRTESDPDTAPGVSRFMPHRPPGVQVAVTVELEGTYTRGMMVVDYMEMLKKKHKAVILKKVDLERHKQLLMNALK